MVQGVSLAGVCVLVVGRRTGRWKLIRDDDTKVVSDGTEIGSRLRLQQGRSMVGGSRWATVAGDDRYQTAAMVKLDVKGNLGLNSTCF